MFLDIAYMLHSGIWGILRPDHPGFRDASSGLRWLAGKVSSDLQAIIRQRPELFAQLIRELKDLPDHALLRLVREVRDGDW